MLTPPRMLLAVTTLVAVVVVPGLAEGGGPAQAAPPQARASQQALSPLIFGHRGAPGYRPEHTLASYDLAVRLGADVIEPDVVSTKDGVLVVRHENEISGTTDVAKHPEFASRRTTKRIDGTELTGWFTEDFTLADLRTLRAVERLPDIRQENTLYDGRYQVPTLQEVLDLATLESRLTGRHIGIAPETKHPTYFDSIGLSLEEPLLRLLDRAGLNRPGTGVYVQSFEEANLRDLRRLGLRTQVVQLTSAGPTARPYDHVASGDPETYAQMTTFPGLREVRTYASWLGPDITQILPRDASGTQLAPTRLVADAHRARLGVVPYTFRAENVFLPAQYRRGTNPTDFGDELSFLQDAFAAGVDGLFADQSDIAFAAREDLYGFGAGIQHPQAAVVAPPPARDAARQRSRVLQSDPAPALAG